MTVERTKAQLRTPDGRDVSFVIELDTTQTTQGTIHRLLRAGQMYETSSSTLLVNLLRPGDAFIDVGAHVGYYAMLARALVGDGGRVFAFEPNPETYRRLATNLAINGFGNVHAFNCAIGARSDVMSLHVNADNEGESALWDVSAAARFPKSGVEHRQVDVAVMTLDEIGRGGLFNRARMVKIDAEGWEPQVLSGARQFLQHDLPPYVICEINRGALKATGGSESGIRRFFAERGYGSYLVNLTRFDICGGGKVCRPLRDDEAVDTPYVFNLLFALRDAPAVG